MKNTLRKTILALGMIASITPAHAFIVNDPSHMAKTVMEGAKRSAEALRQLQMEYNQYLQMVNDAVALRDPFFKPLGDTVRAVNQAYMTTQSVMYQIQNPGSMFGMMYPSYYTYLGSMGQGRSMRDAIAERSKVFSDKGYMNTRNAIISASMRLNAAKAEQALLENLVSQANRAASSRQALDAGNQFLGRMTEQMGDLKSLAAENNMLQANYMSLQIERQTASDAFSENWRRARIIRGQGDSF